jgi:transcriptional repressor NrdR
VSHDEVRAIANRIKLELMEKGVREIGSRELGERVMDHLRKTDVVAYIRFACVYKRFKDIGELVQAIQSIAPEMKEKESHAIEEK